MFEFLWGATKVVFMLGVLFTLTLIFLIRR